jgi:hypothetical protein
MTTTSLPPHLDHVGRQLTAAARERCASPRQLRRKTAWLAAMSTTGVAAAAAAAMFAISATTATTPAFAVVRHQNGSVAVKINRRSGIAGANRKLAAMGIPDRVAAKSDGQSFQVTCMAPGPGADGNSVTIAGSPTVPTGPVYAPPSTTGDTGTGNTGTGSTGAGVPAVGSTWHMVDCSSLAAG